jgi:Cft2 family RNA processing exonuclease
MDSAKGFAVVTTRLIAVSGLGAKGPAAFLIETGSRRILLDFGEGPDGAALPCFEAIGTVDALVLSHGHNDHVGALQHIDRIGRPPVFATERVLRQVPSNLDRRPLPLRGYAEILGLRVKTGRNGHAPGGIWLCFDVGRGFLYTGDYSRESVVYAFDEPPAAETVVLDASYGLSEHSLTVGQDALTRIAGQGPILLPSPADGRGPDMALFLHERGYDVALDDAIHAAVSMLIQESDGRPDVRGRLEALVRAARPLASDSPVQGVMIASNGTGSSGVARELIERWAPGAAPRIVFTGHVGQGSPAERLITCGRASIVRWNVHPRWQDNLQLIRLVEAGQIIPAFLPLSDVQGLSAIVGEAKLLTERVIPL